MSTSGHTRWIIIVSMNIHVNLELYKNNVSKLIFKTYAAPFPFAAFWGGGVTKNKHVDQPALMRLTLETSAVYKDADQSARMYVCFACGLKL